MKQHLFSERTVSLFGCPQVTVTPVPLLAEIVEQGNLRADDADLAALTRLLLAAEVSPGAACKATCPAAGWWGPCCHLPTHPPARLPSAAARI